MLKQNILSSGGKGRAGFPRSRFISLDDTPSAYPEGGGGRLVQINPSGNGLEFSSLQFYSSEQISALIVDAVAEKACGIYLSADGIPVISILRDADTNNLSIVLSENGTVLTFQEDGTLLLPQLTDNGILKTGNGTGEVTVTTDIISKSAVIDNPDGISAARNYMLWKVPFACTVKNITGYRLGGTGATINARKNGSDNHLESALSLADAETFYNNTTIQNATYAAGDTLQAMIVSVDGNPTQILIQIDVERV